MNYEDAKKYAQKAIGRVVQITGENIEEKTGRSCHLTVICLVEPSEGDKQEVMTASSMRGGDLAVLLAECASKVLVKNDERLYQLAKSINHEAGFPWTDPRTGETFEAPEAPK